MKGFLERQCEHVSYLRVGELPKWDRGFGVLRQGAVAHVFGLHVEMTTDFWRTAAEVLMDAGFTHVEFVRLNDDGEFEPHRRLLRRRSHTVSGSCVADAEIEPQRVAPMNQTVITITHTNPDDAADTSELTLKLGKVSDAKRASIDGDFLGVVASWNKAASDAAKS